MTWLPPPGGPRGQAGLPAQLTSDESIVARTVPPTSVVKTLAPMPAAPTAPVPPELEMVPAPDAMTARPVIGVCDGVPGASAARVSTVTPVPFPLAVMNEVFTDALV